MFGVRLVYFSPSMIYVNENRKSDDVGRRIKDKDVDLDGKTKLSKARQNDDENPLI